MGGSTSSLLDENKCNYIRGRSEAELKNFTPHYKYQFMVAYFKQLQDEVEQHKAVPSQLLKQRESTNPEQVIHEQVVLHYVEDMRKWKERYMVVRANYSMECHESRETFLNGASAKSQVLPTGGAVLTCEKAYAALADKFFPDPSGVSDEASPPMVAMPDQFPVYLWQPYRRHSFFCFQDEQSQKRFTTILKDCIRHQNYDFQKQKTFEVVAFLDSVRFYRQEKGHYGSWEMLVGTDVQVMSHLVMEELLPSLQTELLPKLKGKKNERKKTWFATVEGAFGVVQDQISTGLTALQDECRTAAKNQEGQIRSDMDQIINSKNFLAEKLKATVTERAVKCCMDSVQPYLSSILEELMGPISSGFGDIRSLFETEMNRTSKDFQAKSDMEQLKQDLEELKLMPVASPKMQPCYQQVEVLGEQLQELRTRFKFSNTDRLVQNSQNYMQKLMDNVIFTFEQLLSHSLQGDSSQIVSAIERVKQRVVKQYDYDSSTIRKKLFQEALIEITLPTMQKSLAPTFKPELQKFEQYIFADYTNFIQVENVYEDILLQILLSEIDKVVQEAASLKKHNLFEDNADFPCASQFSLADKRTPPGSLPTGLGKPVNLPENLTPPKQNEGILQKQEQIASVDPPASDVLESCASTKDQMPRPAIIDHDANAAANREPVQDNALSDIPQQPLPSNTENDPNATNNGEPVLESSAPTITKQPELSIIENDLNTSSIDSMIEAVTCTIKQPAEPSIIKDDSNSATNIESVPESVAPTVKQYAEVSIIECDPNAMTNTELLPESVTLTLNKQPEAPIIENNPNATTNIDIMIESEATMVNPQQVISIIEDDQNEVTSKDSVSSHTETLNLEKSNDNIHDNENGGAIHENTLQSKQEAPDSVNEIRELISMITLVNAEEKEEPLTIEDTGEENIITGDDSQALMEEKAANNESLEEKAKDLI
ncbi:protein Niban 1a [Erpetoichthys calabaricus]|uniref:protein Niban 1a n=1 Tax=Erpetoichthys calabaricus TaxID=27687 RepID=UPI002233ED75|nr:protein Niban 1a [Erpetoichthys calabaricus]